MILHIFFLEREKTNCHHRHTALRLSLGGGRSSFKQVGIHPGQAMHRSGTGIGSTCLFQRPLNLFPFVSQSLPNICCTSLLLLTECVIHDPGIFHPSNSFLH